MALNNVPLTGQSLGVTRVPVNQNFSVIDTTFAVNHVDYNLTDQGKHKMVTFKVQTVDPTTGAGEINMYTKTDATTTRSEIYLKFDTQPAYPMTESGGNSGIGATGWSYLPSGKKMKWGQVTTAASTGTINLTVAVPAGSPTLTSVQSVQLTALNANGVAWVTNIVGGVITINSAAAISTFGYLVIGQ